MIKIAGLYDKIHITIVILDISLTSCIWHCYLSSACVTIPLQKVTQCGDTYILMEKHSNFMAPHN